MAYKRKKDSQISKLVEGFLEKAVDIALVAVYFNLEFPTYARRNRGKISSEVVNDLEEVNYKTLKRAVVYLRKKGLIQILKEIDSLPKITEEGKKRLSLVLPRYDEERAWDGRVYLITYDLPVERNQERDYLRWFLKKIGCGMLQKSVWITPYNPTKVLEKLLVEKKLGDLILVSSLGKDGAVGEMDLSELMEKVYHLEKINERYKELLENFGQNKLSRSQFIFGYLNILKEDSQLPFELLPEDWKGEEAYKIYKKISQTP